MLDRAWDQGRFVVILLEKFDCFAPGIVLSFVSSLSLVLMRSFFFPQERVIVRRGGMGSRNLDLR